jgi:hypothetical protein
MRFVAAALLLMVLTGDAFAATAAAPETCTSYLTAQREKMIAAALACEGTPTQQRSVRSQAEAERNGDKLLTFNDCSRPLNVVKPEDVFRECVRTHLCAAQTYACAIARTNARSTVKECGAATTACKLTDPIPQ